MKNFGRSSFGESESRPGANIFKIQKNDLKSEVCSKRRYSLNTELQSLQGMEVRKGEGTMVCTVIGYKRTCSSSKFCNRKDSQGCRRGNNYL